MSGAPFESTLPPAVLPPGSAPGGTLDVLVVVNPVASHGAAPELRAAIAKHLAGRGLRHRIVEIASRDEARSGVHEAIRLALGEGCTRIVAAGGDGTVALVGAAIARRDEAGPLATLGIIPAGTANVLAHELGIPQALDAAVEMAFDGERTLDLDAIRAPDRLVFTQVGIGPDAQMIGHTSRQDQIQHGRLAYLATFLKRAAGRPANWFRFDVDGRLHRARAWQVVVANVGAFGTPPFTWGPGIDPTDGALDLCIYDAHSVRGFFTLAWRLLTGGHRRDSNTRFLRVRDQVTIRCSSSQLIQGDGEVLGRTPILLRVLTKALRVVVPREVEDIPVGAGAPGDRAARAGEAAAAEAATAPDGSTSVARDVDAMVAQHSRTWILQGPLRHPLAMLSALDAAVYLRINGLPLGTFGDRLLLVLSGIMHFGEGWAAVAVTMIIADRTTGLRVSAEALAVLWLTMLTVNYPLKRLFRRRRPFIAFVKARVVGPRPTDFSLPSGHSAAAFAGAFLFGAHAPGWAPLFYAVALAVGFSRVYLGVHYPSDVLIGGAFGTGLAMLYMYLLQLFIPALR